ncbi:MAG: diguanylate cyclase, partial [Elusimicrobiota bacterium]|nr:diguanylate cyclase [Elusimicrobiota bacterium]
MDNIKNTALYDFSQSLDGRFTAADDMLPRALELMADYLAADCVLFFNWKEENSIISERLRRQGGQTYYLQEDIFVDVNSPEVIKFLQDGVMDAPSLDYPALYALVIWRTPVNSLKTLQNGGATKSRYGVLRIERYKKNKPFTQEERRLILGLCRELSVKMSMAEVDGYNVSQLNRAVALTELAQLFATSIRLSDSLEEILKSLQRSFNFNRSSLYLADPNSNKLQEALSVDLSGNVIKLDIDESLYKHFSTECGAEFNICPIMAKSDISVTLPLKLQNKNLGWLVFDNILSRVAISQEEVFSLKQFSSQIALAIDNARLFEQVQQLSNYDELTQLSLRRFFNENFAQELYRSKRFNLTFSLIVLDIDYFKSINDD